MNYRDSFEKRQELIGVASVALAGAIQVSGNKGPFIVWNLIIGIPLVLVLAVFSRSHSLTLIERIAMASIWGFTLMSASGFFLQGLYRFIHGMRPLFKVQTLDWEAPAEYYLMWMVVFAIAAYIWITLRQIPRRGTK
jgi:hypothetical protein